MRKIYLTGLLVSSLLATATTYAQSGSPNTTADAVPDSTGMPGDNFSLQGALSMFKKAGSPEELEKLINSQDNGVNNLDLNGDGETDYVKVITKRQDKAQIFVLQAMVSATESQDIAVIELEKTGDNNAVVQITGDEDIYGDSTIVEPQDESGAFYKEETGEDGLVAMANKNAHGPNVPMGAYHSSGIGIIVNVWAWPCVRFVYAPAYVPWVSPWGWRRYPTYWHPWRPLAWRVYRPIRYRYYPHYAVVRTRRVVVAHRLYRPARVTSVTVYNRNRVVVNNYRAARTTRASRVTRPTRVAVRDGGRYQTTRRTTTVTGPRGNQVTRSRTTVTGPRGNQATRTRTSGRTPARRRN